MSGRLRGPAPRTVHGWQLRQPPSSSPAPEPGQRFGPSTPCRGRKWWPRRSSPRSPAYSDTGSAVIDRLPDGRRELVVTSTGDDAQGYREVWLLAPDATSMVSLGTMEGTEAHFELPADLDLSRYPVVDVSDEPYDGDPAHSGDSILRGELDL